MTDWQPIETAPRDSSRILVAYKDGWGEWKVHEAKWYTPWEGAPDRDCYWIHGEKYPLLDKILHKVGASHWMPLPPPPVPK